MKNILQTLSTILLLAPLLSGCATNGNSYFAQRRADLTDVAHADLVGFSFGIAANVGPAVLGHNKVEGFMRKGERIKLGLGGIKTTNLDEGATTGVLVPISRINVDTQDGQMYSTKDPTWGSIGLDAGFIYGVGIHFDVVEFADFLLGVVGLDIIGDDDQLPAQQQNAPYVQPALEQR